MFIKKWGKQSLIGILVMFALLLSGCSSSGSSSQNSIDATLTDFKIQLSSDTATAGQVTFHVKNQSSALEHQFAIFKTDLDASKLPTDAQGNVDESQLQKVDSINLQPNASQDLSVNLAAGHYAIICNLPGHYSQGMYTNFTAK